MCIDMSLMSPLFHSISVYILSSPPSSSSFACLISLFTYSHSLLLPSSCLHTLTLSYFPHLVYILSLPPTSFLLFTYSHSLLLPSSCLHTLTPSYFLPLVYILSLPPTSFRCFYPSWIPLLLHHNISFMLRRFFLRNFC